MDINDLDVKYRVLAYVLMFGWAFLMYMCRDSCETSSGEGGISIARAQSGPRALDQGRPQPQRQMQNGWRILGADLQDPPEAVGVPSSGVPSSGPEPGQQSQHHHHALIVQPTGSLALGNTDATVPLLSSESLDQPSSPHQTVNIEDESNP